VWEHISHYLFEEASLEKLERDFIVCVEDAEFYPPSHLLSRQLKATLSPSTFDLLITQIERKRLLKCATQQFFSAMGMCDFVPTEVPKGTPKDSAKAMTKKHLFSQGFDLLFGVQRDNRKRMIRRIQNEVLQP
jgi:hypothetical protein